jgi:putative CocE/NonD family hydrolase
MPQRRTTTTLLTAALLAVGLVLPTGPTVASSGEATASRIEGRTPPTLPAPRYQSVSHEVLIRMDDGVKLGATIALPSRDGEHAMRGKFPVVVGMTPYGRNGLCGCYAPDFWATRGIAGAVVDVRGTGGSGGDLGRNYFSPREARDGAAVVEWLGTRKWSTGKVGMAGGSYVGITQLLTAGRRPEHLAAIAPQVAMSDIYRDAFAHGGVPSLFFDGQYLGVQGGPGALSGNNDPALLQETVEAKLGQSPPGTLAFDYLERPNDSRFYARRSPINVARRIEVPVLLVGGWRDGLSQRGNPELFRVLSRRRGVETRMSMDPCVHKGCGAPFAPLTDPPNQQDPAALVYEFLAKHLLGKPAPDRPRVEYYLQGAGHYATASTWPPSGTELRRFDLAGGTIRPHSARRERGQTSYVTNPAAGMSMTFNQYGTVAATPYVPLDQRLEGPNGATFRTRALERPLRLTGPMALHLVASSTATDTDWHARVVDVAPDGSESVITEGSLRAAHRALDRRRSTWARPYHPHTDPAPIEPGRFYEYAIEIWPTAYRLARGHRLQVRVTSTDLPTHLPGWIDFDRDDPSSSAVHVHEPAMNTIRFRGSYLVLPVG